MNRTALRTGVVAVAASVGVAALAAPALAHVTVTTIGPATQGGYAVLDFKVPSESDTASTIKLDVTFDTPVASADPQIVPGWTIKTKQVKLPQPVTTDDGTITVGVGEIVWTANGTTAKDGVPPGDFQQFFVSAGTLPTADKMTFRAIQTYSDGSVVKWIEPTIEGQPEPDHPAPSLVLTPADATSSTPAATAPTAASTASVKDSTSRALGIAGIVVGALGLLTAVAALGRRRNA
ncbi:MAG TPA: YcnI family protein [Mycobacteriales bacterium]|nr:YcnI family protein [Mycobacteriales bacterium]